MMRTRLSATEWPTAFRPISRTMPSFVLVSTRYQWPLSSAACGEGGPASSCAHSDIVKPRNSNGPGGSSLLDLRVLHWRCQSNNTEHRSVLDKYSTSQQLVAVRTSDS